MNEGRGAGVETLFAGRFVLELEAGRGGMGIVHRAFDRVEKRIVALKVLHKTEPSTVRRFALEADALGKLDHPNIVRYLAHGVAEDGAPYLALEWIEGESLRARSARAATKGESLAIDAIVELGQRLAGALAAAHAVGIVHRDVKPSNILLADGNLGRPKLLDFGIVRAASAEQHTTTGTVLGTVGYMAPEQARGAAQLDGRADLFSLGCVLFRCLTNRDVFDGPDPMTVLSMLLLHKPPPVSALRPDVPPDLEALVARLLAKEPKDRPASAAEVHDALARIGVDLLGATQTSRRDVMPSSSSRAPADSQAATKGRRPRWVAAIAMAVVLLGIGIAFHSSRRPPEVHPAAVTAPPAATILTTLPASPTCAPRAVELYQRGMRAMREGRWREAASLFRQGVDVDGSCPQLRLRGLLVGSTLVRRTTKREHLREAMRFRDAFSARDRMVLDAFAALVTEEVPLRDESLRLLDEAVHRYPMDAEIHVLSAFQKVESARSREDLEGALALARRAAEIDPPYSDAWQAQATVLEDLGRDSEAQAALEQCLKVSPGSVDCMARDMVRLWRTGQCESATAVARRWSSWEPEESQPYAMLATSLSAADAPKEAIEEVLLLRWNRLPPEWRERERLFESSQLEAWAGHFDAAHELAERLEHQLAASMDREPHWAAAMQSVDSLLESGEIARAGRVAEQALVRRDAWVPDKTAIADVAPVEPGLLAAALRGGRLAAPAWRKAMTAWTQTNDTALNDFERWVFKWASTMDAPFPAAEVMAEMPDGEHHGVAGQAHGKWRIGMLDAYAGRLYAHTGDMARALPLLEAGVDGCAGINFPFIHVRANLWLGMAKEKLGDTAAACKAYRYVIDRWGHATPRSVTAQEATRRSRALACK